MKLVTREQYEEMWNVYQRDQTAGSLMRELSISRQTARKYITVGDPRRGLEPLQKRHAALTKATSKAADYDLARAQAETLRVTRAAKGVLARQVNELLKDPAAQLKNPTQALRDIHTVEAAILGGLGETIGISGASAPSPFDGLQDDEVLTFLEQALPVLKQAGFGRSNGHDPNELPDVATVVH